MSSSEGSHPGAQHSRAPHPEGPPREAPHADEAHPVTHPIEPPGAPAHHAAHHRLRNTRAAKRARLFRARLNLHPRLRMLYKILVGIVGIAVVVIGIILIPLPGPGWLIVFLGLALLGTEFPIAHRFNMWVQHTLRRFWNAFRARRAARAESRRAAAESRRATAASQR